MAVARRKAIERRERVQKIVSKRQPAGLIAHADDGRLFFLSSKDVRRTRVSARTRVMVERILAKQDRGRRSDTQTFGCTKTLRWLLTHNPNSVQWRKVGAWWLKAC